MMSSFLSWHFSKYMMKSVRDFETGNMDMYDARHYFKITNLSFPIFKMHSPFIKSLCNKKHTHTHTHAYTHREINSLDFKSMLHNMLYYACYCIIKIFQCGVKLSNNIVVHSFFLSILKLSFSLKFRTSNFKKGFIKF